MPIENQGPATHDAARDPRLARLLSLEFGSTETELAALTRDIMTAVAQRSNDVRAWWSVIAAWSRTVVPIGVALAAAALVIVVNAPSELMTHFPSSYPDAASARGVGVVDILATRTTSDDVIAVFVPPTADELLKAAVRR
jgi:hypothetical protein